MDIATVQIIQKVERALWTSFLVNLSVVTTDTTQPGSRSGRYSCELRCRADLRCLPRRWELENISSDANKS
jgi:hypothetical protein